MSDAPANTVGTHVLSELSGCVREKLANPVLLMQELHAAAQTANATILGSSFQRFGATGVSGTVGWADGNIGVRTWPECGHAALDIYSGAADAPRVMLGYLVKALGARACQTIEVERGVADPSGIFWNRVVAVSEPPSAPAPAVEREDSTTGKTTVRKRYAPSPINLI